MRLKDGKGNNCMLLNYDMETFRQLADNLQDTVVLFSNEQVLYVNAAFEKVYGRSASELYKHGISYIKTIIHPDDIPGFKKKESKIFKPENKSKAFIFRILKSKNKKAYIKIQGFPVFNNVNELVCFALLISDITKIAQLESFAKLGVIQQAAILENMPYHAWLKDMDGKYIVVNENFARSYKLSPADIKGKTDFDFCPADKAKEFKNSDRKVLRNKTRIFLEQVEDLPGGKTYFETFKSPVFDESGCNKIQARIKNC